MRKSKGLILAGAAAMAALPMVAGAAVTLNITLDPTTLAYGTPNTASSGWTQLTIVPNSAGAYYVPAAGSTPLEAFIPAGDGIVYGYDMTMTGSNAGTSVGVAAASFGVNNSNKAFALPFGATATSSNATILNGVNTVSFAAVMGNAAAYTTSSAEKSDTKSGGIGSTLGFTVGGGSYPANGFYSNTMGGTPGTPAVYNIEFDLQAGATGTDTLTPNTLDNTASKFPATYQYVASGGTTGTQFTFGTDVLNINSSSAVLTLAVASGTSSSTSSTNHHPIVTLGNTALGSSYGSQLGATLNMIGSHGSYLPAFTGLISPPQATGFAAATGFNPITDTEVYALQLNYSGGVVSPSNTTLIAAIISDINNGTGVGTGASNVSASTITGAYASLFPSYDILLTSSALFTAGANGVANLGIDFSQDTDAATPGLVVTEVAAVPEPATFAGVVLGAAGLLLGRRKKQAATA